MVAKKPPRGTSLVVSAIRKLRDVQGTSSRAIMNFIASEYDVSGPSLKRHVQMALRRGMSYGIIHRDKGGYYLSNPKGLTISCDTLVDRSRRGRCKGRRKRRKSRRGKCRRRGSRRGRRARRGRRGRGRCRGKRSKRRRRGGKRRCGRRGRRRGGDDEMDEMAVTLGRGAVGTRKTPRLGRSKFPERIGNRSKSPSDRSSATRSSGGSSPLENPNQM